MNQKAKSRTDGDQAALETSIAWVSSLHFIITAHCRVWEVRHVA